MKFWSIGLLVLALAVAGSLTIAKERSYKLDLDLEGLVGGKNLRASTYRVVIKCGEDGRGTVTFYDGYRMVAQVPCNMIAVDSAADFYGVSYGKDASGKKVVAAIFLKGEKEKVVINTGN